MSEPGSKKSAFVAIVGRPSAGKSTLMNTLCGEKVAIASPIPQTTRNRIRGIVTTDAGQLVFVDTPGFHVSHRTLNRHMRGLIEEAIRDSEVLLYVVDASRKPGAEELELLDAVASQSVPKLIALNKIDVTPREQRRETLSLLEERLPGTDVIEISALREDGTDELLAALYERAPEGELHYDPEFYTDQDPEFRIAEIIREKALSGLREELPHSIYVHVADMEIEPLDRDANDRTGERPDTETPRPGTATTPRSTRTTTDNETAAAESDATAGSAAGREPIATTGPAATADETPSAPMGAAPGGTGSDTQAADAPESSAAEVDAGNHTQPAGAPEGFFDESDRDPADELASGKPGDRLWIRAFVYVERNSQQGMIVGKKGAGIKRIRQSAQKEIARLFPYRIHLDLRVKVDPNWSKNEYVLGRLVQ